MDSENMENSTEEEIYIIVQLPEYMIDEDALLKEGKWVSSGEKNWMQRVDPENPSAKLQRHVHIARSKHINSKNMQASWNQNGSRHDRSSFNKKIGSLNVVRDIARRALKLDKDVMLEEMSKDGW